MIAKIIAAIRAALRPKVVDPFYDIDPSAEDMYSLDQNTIDSTMIYAAMPGIQSFWIEHIQSVFARHSITGRDAALLLAHIGHESSDLRRLQENMNYSAERLMQVWPSRFRTVERAREFERNPEKLANEVYGNRMGNTHTGDGWKFRGRGPIQITGRSNYEELARDTGLDCVNDPDVLVKDMSAGIESACWYWNKYVPNRTIEGSTRNINGGLHGLQDRARRFEAASRYV